MIEHYKSELFDIEGCSIWAFKKTMPGDIKKINPELSIKDDEDIKRDHYILCRVCYNIITSHNTIIEIDGNHQHTFNNPSGFVYHIGCFKAARGCMNFGDPTLEFSWFPGFYWCYTICSNCFNHLGWFFQSNGNCFYGLILNQLIENI